MLEHCRIEFGAIFRVNVHVRMGFEEFLDQLLRNIVAEIQSDRGVIVTEACDDVSKTAATGRHQCEVMRVRSREAMPDDDISAVLGASEDSVD